MQIGSKENAYIAEKCNPTQRYRNATLRMYRGSQIPCVDAAQSSRSYPQSRLHLSKKKKPNPQSRFFCQFCRKLKYDHSPREIALTKIVKASMKMMIDARPNRMINFLTMCCPVRAAMVATMTKYDAEKEKRKHVEEHIHLCFLQSELMVVYQCLHIRLNTYFLHVFHLLSRFEPGIFAQI